MRHLALALLALSAASLDGCGHVPGDPPNSIPRPTDVTDFATLYSENCSACHGVNGQNGPAIDLANPEYQALVDDAALRKWISGGMPGTEMAAFAQSAGGMLAERQVNALITGMRRHWLQSNFFRGATPPAYAQSETGDPSRGQQDYQARCAVCHSPSSQQIISPNYLSLVGNQALRSVIIAGRPDIGQPDWRHDGPGAKATTPLSAEEVDDIVSYLGSLRNPAPEQAASSVQRGR
ncbi:MAG TPA: c-type cytochrome [Terracidiphilus sp.]|nr:c-type cytochrome [Terracidiphilus sp.]